MKQKTGDTLKKEAKKFEMIKTYGNPKASNLIIGWGSTKGAILDTIDSIDRGIKTGKGNYRFLQVLYMKPLSDDIKKEIHIIVNSRKTKHFPRL